MRSVRYVFLTLPALAALTGCGGINLASTPPPPPAPIREVARTERGVIMTVRDTKLDLRTGRPAAIQTSTPGVGVGPFGVALPVGIGGEKKVEVPAEEITVKLGSGKMIGVVQPLSSPPFAVGMRVDVVYEKVDDPRDAARMEVRRVD